MAILMWVLGTLGVLLNGCQSGAAGTHIALNLQMPASLAKHGGRYQKFLSRVTHLEVTLLTEKRVLGRFTFPPNVWENIPLSQAELANVDEAVTLRAEVWDRNREGGTRSYPVLAGKRRLATGEAGAGQPVSVWVKLGLQVDPREYD